jgi:hypothetical protein
MGSAIANIARRCDDYASEHVLMFSLVWNPNPELVQMIPHEQREHFVRALTETSMSRFLELRGIDTGLEWSYVTHHRLSENPESPGLHDPHTHVVLPGTYYDDGCGERVPLFFSRNRQENHIEMLHAVTEAAMRDLMDIYAGRDWEQRFDALEAVRAQQRAITEEAPHGSALDEHGQRWDFWCGARRTNEGESAIGYYRTFPSDSENPRPEETQIEFRPIVSGLEREHAEQLAAVFGGMLRENPEWRDLNQYVRAVEAMFAQDEAVEIAPPESDIEPGTPTLDL